VPGAIPFVIPFFVKVAVVGTISGILSSIFEPDLKSSAGMSAKGIKANVTSMDEPLKVIYGTAMVGGCDVFRATTGMKNKTLWVAQTLGEGLCDGIAQVDGVDQVFFGDKLYNTYGDDGDLITYTFHDGAADQVYDAALYAAQDPLAPSLRHDDNYRNVCYVLYRCDYDYNWFQNLPARTVLVRGRKCFDFRDDTTAWTQNPVLCLHDFMTSTLYGEGFPAADFDLASWTAAANYCDLKGFTLNGVISPRTTKAEDIRDMILRHFRGALREWNNTWYLSYYDLNYETSVMDIDEEKIVHDEQGRPLVSISQPGRIDRPESLSVQFVNPAKNYTDDAVLVGDRLGMSQDLPLPLCNSRELALIIGNYTLERMRLDRTVQVTVRDDAQKLEPGDVITFSCEALGITDNLMRVSEASIRPDGLVDLTLIYEDEALYDDDYDASVDAVYTCNLPNPQEEPPGVSNAVMTEETYSYRDRSFTKLKISFDEPTTYAWYDHVEVWKSHDDIEWVHAFDTTAGFEIDPADEGKTYYIRLKVVNTWGVKQRDANDFKVSRTVAGYVTAPASVAALLAVVNANAINLYATRLTDTDIDLYEFRLGSSWSGGILLASMKFPNLSLYGVKPGDHTFWINTLSNNGQYGATPRSISVSLPAPPKGWTLQGTENDDFSAGSHSNTEAVVYSGADHLKCSHAGGVLVGTYTGPVIDLSTVTSRFIYIGTSIVVTGAGTTWDDVLPGSTTWAEIDIANKTWAQIFELPSGPAVRISLEYGETSPPANTVEKLEICGTVVSGRYVRPVVEITDPSPAVNALVEALTISYCT